MSEQSATIASNVVAASSQVNQYVSLEQAQRVLDQQAAQRNNRWYPRFHIALPAGKTAQPFGLCYFQNRWHVMFQSNIDSMSDNAPYCAHVSSDDLIHWQSEPLLLAPDAPEDNGGIYAGSTVVSDDGQLWIFYTGTHCDDDGTYDNICAAVSTDGVHATKLGAVIECPEGYRAFRNPRVSRLQQHWVMVVGASTDDHRGQILKFTSDNLRIWHFDGVLYQHPNPGVYMLESPDFFSIKAPDGHDAWVLGFCARGEHPNGFSSRNLRNAGYIIGDYTADGFIAHTEFRMWDWGHNFYAPTTVAAPDGRRLLIAWMSSFVPPIVTAMEDGWCDQLSCIREITLDEYHCLRFQPLRESQALRYSTQEFGAMCIAINQTIQLADRIEAAEVIVDINLDASTAERPGINVHVNGEGHCSVYYDKLINRVVLDRAANPHGDRGYRAAPFTSQRLRLHILLDAASIEVFVNDGEQVLSSYSYPHEGPTSLCLSSESGTMDVEHITLHRLRV